MLIKPTNYEELSRLADILMKTDFVPNHYNKESLMIIILFGMETGLPPIASIRNIFMVDRQPVISGDAMLSLIYSSNLLKDYKQYYEAKEDKVIVTVSRKDNNITITSEFSMEDARKANLLDKPIWKQYPKRMLLYRARSYALRDCFPDILKGLRTKEEVEDSITNNNIILPPNTIAEKEVKNDIEDNNDITTLSFSEIMNELRIDNNIDNSIGIISKEEDNNSSNNSNTEYNNTEDFIEVMDF